MDVLVRGAEETRQRLAFGIREEDLVEFGLYWTNQRLLYTENIKRELEDFSYLTLMKPGPFKG